MKRTALALTLISVLLFSVIAGTKFANLASAQSLETITIKADGSVEGTDKIQRNGDVFLFSDNITGPLFVERDNIVVDGAGRTLQGASGRGIVLSGRSNVTIRNVNVELAGGYGIYLVDSSSNIISDNCVIGSDLPYAIYIWRSFNNIVEDNNVTNSFRGILIYDSYSNIVTGNNVTNNVVGIELHDCFNNVLRDNHMNNNSNSFSVRLYPSYEYINDVDTTNTIDGAPIFYWVNEEDKTVPSNAACVILVNCTRITVQNLNLSRNGQGILLLFTTNSTIANNTISNGGSQGIGLIHSSNNRIVANSVQDQSTGIQLEESSNNDIIENYISRNDRGIRTLYSSNNNVISGNNITANDYGIDDLQTSSSTGNTILGNN